MPIWNAPDHSSSSPTGSPEVAACATRLSPGTAEKRNAPRKPIEIRNGVSPKGIASSDNDGITSTYRSSHIPASPKADTVPRTIGVFLVRTLISTVNGISQINTTQATDSGDHGM